MKYGMMGLYIGRKIALGLLAPFVAAFCAEVVRAEVPELRIGVQYGMGYLPVYVADQAGFFKKRFEEAGLSIPVTIQNVTGASQITDGLLSKTMDIGCGGITAMLVSWEKTKQARGQAMKGIVALSSIPYELLTVNPALKSLKDFGDQNKIGVTAIRVSIPAILLQMEAERTFGAGQYGKLDPMTVSLAQPDAAAALLSGSGVIDSYVFAPPFNYQLRQKPGIHVVWSSADFTGGPITSLSMWATSQFREDNPRIYKAVLAAMHDAVDLIKTNPEKAAAIFIKKENSKLSPDFIAQVLREPGLRFDLAPQRSVELAAFLARTGLLKTKPDNWKDYFFPEIHMENGS